MIQGNILFCLYGMYQLPCGAPIFDTWLNLPVHEFQPCTKRSSTLSKWAFLSFQVSALTSTSSSYDSYLRRGPQDRRPGSTTSLGWQTWVHFSQKFKIAHGQLGICMEGNYVILLTVQSNLNRFPLGVVRSELGLLNGRHVGRPGPRRFPRENEARSTGLALTSPGGHFQLTLACHVIRFRVAPTSSWIKLLTWKDQKRAQRVPWIFPTL